MARLFVRASSQHVTRTFSGPVSNYSLTLAAWVYPTTLPAVSWIVHAGGAGQYGIPMLSTGAVRAQITDGGVASTAEGGTLTTGTWHHVAAIFTSSTLFIYVNGTQVGTGACTEIWPTISVYSVGRDSGGSNYFDGRIAEHGAWAATLTAAEIAALAKGVSPQMIRPASLRLYWPLWGVASPEVDLSGNGYTGTVTGATLANHCPAGPPVPFVG